MATSREISLQTSEGNIIAEHLKGAFVTAKATSKGDIETGLIEAHADVNLRNGDIQIGQIIGSLLLKSSNGDVNVGVEKIQNVRIQSSNGDVTLSAPENFAATLDLAGKSLDLGGWGVVNPGTEPELKMAMHQGAPLIHVRATNGAIVLLPLENFSISSATSIFRPFPLQLFSAQ